jgi:hypothetical protein
MHLSLRHAADKESDVTGHGCVAVVENMGRNLLVVRVFIRLARLYSSTQFSVTSLQPARIPAHA